MKSFLHLPTCKPTTVLPAKRHLLQNLSLLLQRLLRRTEMAHMSMRKVSPRRTEVAVADVASAANEVPSGANVVATVASVAVSGASAVAIAVASGENTVASTAASTVASIMVSAVAGAVSVVSMVSAAASVENMVNVVAAVDGEAVTVVRIAFAFYADNLSDLSSIRPLPRAARGRLAWRSRRQGSRTR